MKLFLLLLIPLTIFAQETPDAFGRRIFRAVIDNDQAAFETAIAARGEFGDFFRQIDSTIADSLPAPGYEKYVEFALKGFTLCQETVAELKLDTKTIMIDRVEVEDLKLLLERNGQTFTPVAKTVTIFFTCSGKNMAFMIYDAIAIHEKLFLGDKIVQIHWLD